MKKFSITTYILALSLGITIGLASTAAFAQSAQSTPPTDEHTLEQCSQNWQDFLSSIVGYQDFVEYWTDITRLNLCHRTDIDYVEQQLQKARRQLRSAFLRCEPNRTGRLAEAYHKLEVELYFLRTAFDESPNGSVDYLLRDSNGKLDQAKWDELIAGIQKRSQNFIRKYITYFGDSSFESRGLINSYFQEFDAKYSGNRLHTYNNCRDETWGEITDKLNELVQNFKDFGQAAAHAGQTIARDTTQGAQAIGESFSSQENNKGSLRSGPILSFDEGFDLNLRLARLKVTPDQSFEELTAPGQPVGNLIQDIKTLTDDNPDTLAKRANRANTPFSELPFKIESENTRVQEELSRAELKAKFDTLYADLNDDAANAFSDKLQSLIDTVHASIPKLDTIESCVDQVGSRECQNK